MHFGYIRGVHSPSGHPPWGVTFVEGNPVFSAPNCRSLCVILTVSLTAASDIQRIPFDARFMDAGKLENHGGMVAGKLPISQLEVNFCK